MTISTVDAWHELVRLGNTQGLASLLADNAVFYSPIVHTPQVGKAITTQYLTAAIHVLANVSFHYVREVIGKNDAVLEFQAEIEGISINGIDMFTWNEAGLITEFKVFLRPLKAINLVHQKMGAMLLANMSQPQAK